MDLIWGHIFLELVVPPEYKYINLTHWVIEKHHFSSADMCHTAHCCSLSVCSLIVIFSGTGTREARAAEWRPEAAGVQRMLSAFYALNFTLTIDPEKQTRLAFVGSILLSLMRRFLMKSF